MINKSIFLLTLSAVAWGKPNPISVYQQDDGSDQQEYQQPIQQYRPAPKQQQYQQQAAPRPQRPIAYKQVPQGLQQGEDYEQTEPPQPYQFQFDVNDDENTNYQNRKEQREGNKITGSYSVVDSDGFIRTVTYTADPVEGFKAHVSREPTNIVVKPRDPAPQSALQSQQYPSAAAPKLQYAPAGKAPGAGAGVQYSGAALGRPQPASSTPRRQQTQQYLQGAQQQDDPYAAFQP